MIVSSVRMGFVGKSAPFMDQLLWTEYTEEDVKYFPYDADITIN